MDSVFVVIIGGILALINGLVLYSIKRIADRIDRQDDRISDLETRFAACKVESSQSNVTKEEWVRSEALTRRKLDDVVGTLATMNGKLEVVQQLPDIAGRIAREIAGALKIGG